MQEEKGHEEQEGLKIYGWNSIPNPIDIDPKSNTGTDPKWQQEEGK